MTNPKPRWMTNPQTEAEWDAYILKYGSHLGKQTPVGGILTQAEQWPDRCGR